MGTVRTRRRVADDAGTVSIEFLILANAVIILFFSLMILAGRVLIQENEVRSAAQAAARAASLIDDRTQAGAHAEEIAAQNLSATGISCLGGPRVRIVDEQTLFEPGGYVTVEVECTAPLLGGLGISENDYGYRATEVIDVFRGGP